MMNPPAEPSPAHYLFMPYLPNPQHSAVAAHCPPQPPLPVPHTLTPPAWDLWEGGCRLGQTWQGQDLPRTLPHMDALFWRRKGGGAGSNTHNCCCHPTYHTPPAAWKPACHPSRRAHFHRLPHPDSPVSLYPPPPTQRLPAKLPYLPQALGW